MSIGWVLIKSILDMAMEVSQTLWPWEQACANNRDLSDTSAAQATHAVVSMSTDVLQVAVGLDDTIASGRTCGHSDASLLL